MSWKVLFLTTETVAGWRIARSIASTSAECGRPSARVASCATPIWSSERREANSLRGTRGVRRIGTFQNSGGACAVCPTLGHRSPLPADDAKFHRRDVRLKSWCRRFLFAGTEILIYRHQGSDDPLDGATNTPGAKIDGNRDDQTEQFVHDIDGDCFRACWISVDSRTGCG